MFTSNPLTKQQDPNIALPARASRRLSLPLPVRSSNTIVLGTQQLPGPIGTLRIALFCPGICQQLECVATLHCILGSGTLFALLPAQLGEFFSPGDERVERPPSLAQHAAQVVPRGLILRSELHHALGIGDFAIRNGSRDAGIELGREQVGRAVCRIAKDEKEAMTPGGIVAHVVLDPALRGRDFPGAEEGERAHHPLPVAPDVVVLCVFLKHLVHKGDFGLAKLNPSGGIVGDRGQVHRDEELAVVPDLVVFLMLQRHLVEPGHLACKGNRQRRHYRKPIEPDRVMRRVETDNMCGQVERSSRVFFCRHDGAQIGSRCTQIVSVMNR